MAHSSIVKEFVRVDQNLVDKAAVFAASILADVAGRRGVMHGRIAALTTSMSCAGSALTVEVRPGDNLMIHAAISIAKAGDVLVIDGKSDRTAALMGEIMITACKRVGIAGVVIDGAIRDRIEIERLGFPVFCVGTNPNGPTKNIAGRIGLPISCGGVSVQPGDFVLGDSDGVVVVEHARLSSILPLAQKKVEDEAKRIAQINAGRTAADWLDDALRAAGVLGAGQHL
jgi:regulator of RNase E activity RraA